MSLLMSCGSGAGRRFAVRRCLSRVFAGALGAVVRRRLVARAPAPARASSRVVTVFGVHSVDTCGVWRGVC
jgi:hypothetical protein